jgi:phenylpropionate dioxygenase-like ring-hydroxylating dioxygenase large terminal subunit
MDTEAQPVVRRNLDPTDGPLSLARRYYTDETVLRRELDTVFRSSWLMVAHESEIPDPGDYVTRRMGTDEVVVARSDGGEFNVMINACTHRGTLLCKADRGNSSNFRCGYHGWTFSNEGELRGVPRFRELYGEDFDKTDFPLLRARTDVYRGLVFATFDQGQVDLHDYLGGMRFYLDTFLAASPAGNDAVGRSIVFEHQGNWKTEADNFAGDGYHLRYAHRAGFDMGLMGGQGGRTEGASVRLPFGHTLRTQRAVSDEPGYRFPGYPESRWPQIEEGLSLEQREFFADSAVIHGLIFPNLAFIHMSRPGGLDDKGVTAASVQLRVLNPASADVTEERCWTIVPKDYDEEFKSAAYKCMLRQHGAAAFFESDDMENFRRMMQTGHGSVAHDALPANFDLAIDKIPFAPWFEGPGHVVGADISEVNQRWFYRHYLAGMDS